MEKDVYGYQDFIETYEKLEKIRKEKTLDSHMFIYCVANCAKYIQSLDPYEYQMAITVMPSLEEKIDTVNSLYTKVKTAIVDSLNEVSQKTDSPQKLA